MSMIKIFKGKEKIQLDQLHILPHSFWPQKHSVQCIWDGFSIWRPQLAWCGTKCLLRDMAQKPPGAVRLGALGSKELCKKQHPGRCGEGDQSFKNWPDLSKEKGFLDKVDKCFHHVLISR